MAITDWPVDERPREKLLQRGVGALSDAELLAIFLRVGVAGQSAVDLARTLLLHFGSLEALFAASPNQLTEVRGMGMAKYVQLQSVLELARRALAEASRQQDALSSPQAVRDYLHLLLRGRQQEVFMGVFLNAQHQVICSEALFMGTLTQAAVYPREVLKRALHHHAAALIIAHNHPSGCAEPSGADRALTRELRDALRHIDVQLLDHFLIAGSQAISFAEQGLM